MQCSAETLEGDFEHFLEKITIKSLRKSRLSVTLANPSLPDCPLIACSKAFEEMTGYKMREIVGKNCRFLSLGCKMPKEVRQQMRYAMRNLVPFAGILTNRRSNGEQFLNLLLSRPLQVGDAMLILGVQADVTDACVDTAAAESMAEFDHLVDVVSKNMVEWASLEMEKYEANKLAMQPKSIPIDPTRLDGHIVVRLRSSKDWIFEKNSFLERWSPHELYAPLRAVASESDLPAYSEGVPAYVLNDVLSYIHFADSPFGASKMSSTTEEGKEDARGDEGFESTLLSRGSALHPDGCVPCSFHCYSHSVCREGRACNYCHRDHTRKTRRRGSVRDRQRV